MVTPERSWSTTVDENRIALTIPEFCDRMGTSRSGLYRMWDRGEGPDRIKVGKRTLITVEAVRRWVSQLEKQKNA